MPRDSQRACEARACFSALRAHPRELTAQTTELPMVAQVLRNKPLKLVARTRSTPVLLPGQVALRLGFRANQAHQTLAGRARAIEGESLERRPHVRACAELDWAPARALGSPSPARAGAPAQRRANPLPLAACPSGWADGPMGAGRSGREQSRGGGGGEAKECQLLLVSARVPPLEPCGSRGSGCAAHCAEAPRAPRERDHSLAVRDRRKTNG